MLISRTLLVRIRIIGIGNEREDAIVAVLEENSVVGRRKMHRRLAVVTMVVRRGGGINKKYSS